MTREPHDRVNTDSDFATPSGEQPLHHINRSSDVVQEALQRTKLLLGQAGLTVSDDGVFEYLNNAVAAANLAPVAPQPTRDAAGARSRDDLGIVLSALRFMEEAVGEKFDDEGGVIAQIERDHAAAEGAGDVRDLLKRIRDFPHNSTSSEQSMSQLAGTAIALIDAPRWSPQPAPDAMLEATQAQHVGRPKGEPAKFVRNGILETCRCFDCRALSAPMPPADDPEGPECAPMRFENEVDEEGFTVSAKLVPVPSPEGAAAELADRAEGCLNSRNSAYPSDVLRECIAFLRTLSPSGIGAAEPAARPNADQLAVALDAIVAACRNHGKLPTETIVQFIDRLATPPVRGDRDLLERGRPILEAAASGKPVMMASVDILRDVKRFLSLPVQSGAGERPRWKHKNRGTMYTEIGRGKLQTMDAGGLTDNEPMVIYRGDDGQLWCRDQVEFEDGRFEFVPPGSRQPPQSSREAAPPPKPQRTQS